MNIPQQLAKGNSYSWHDDSVSDNEGNQITPADWTLKFAIRGASTGLDLTATTDGEQWLTSISIAQSTALAVGLWYWEAYFVDNPTTPTRKISYATGEIRITANISASSTYDGRSQVERDLAACESAISNMAAGNAVQSYTIGTRAIHKMTMTDLIQMRAHLKYRLAQEKRADSLKNGLGDPRNIFVRFNK